MTDNPKRFATGGYARGKPCPLPLYHRSTEQVRPRDRRCIAIPCPSASTDFKLADLDRMAVDFVKDMARSFIARAVLESAARAVALELVQTFGVTKSLRAVRSLPRPLRQLDQVILAKLEAVAEHLGAP